MKQDPLENPIIGPRAHEREKKLTPDQVRLANGVPLYYAFLDNPNAINLSPTEVQSAKSRLSKIIAADINGTLSCNGKSLEEARNILESIEATQLEQSEQAV